jgi:hypothetical protein
MRKRIAVKRARRVASVAATLATIYETTRPSFWAIGPREQKENIRYKARAVERYMPTPLVSKRTAKAVARAHYRRMTDAK